MLFLNINLEYYFYIPKTNRLKNNHKQNSWNVYSIKISIKIHYTQLVFYMNFLIKKVWIVNINIYKLYFIYIFNFLLNYIGRLLIMKNQLYYKP